MSQSLHGQLRVFTDDQMQEVHDRACKILEEKGIVFEADSSIEYFKKAGCKVSDHTVFIPKALVEKCVASTPKQYTIDAIDPKNSLEIGGTNIAIHPAGGEPFVTDYKGFPRAANRQDFINFQKLYNWAPNVNIGGYQPCSPVDIPDRMRGLYMTFDSFDHNTKPVISPMELDNNLKREESLKLFEIAYGGKEYLENHYVTWATACPNSPYYYAQFPCEAIETYAKHNQPVLIVSAPMSGITGPVYLLGNVILAMAESLACLVLAQLVREGVPVIMSSTLTYGYMRKATWVPSSPDSALMLAAVIQMNRKFYNLPSRSQTGCTSSKLNDYQAGMETMQSFLFCALAGVNITAQTSGSMADLMSSSLEKIVLDDELISRVRYMVDGIKFDDEQIGWEDLMEAEPLDNFMAFDSTVEEYREHWDPTVSDWNSIDDWRADGAKSAEDRAHEKVVQVLNDEPESVLDPAARQEMLDYIKFVEKGGEEANVA